MGGVSCESLRDTDGDNGKNGSSGSADPDEPCRIFSAWTKAVFGQRAKTCAFYAGDSDSCDFRRLFHLQRTEFPACENVAGEGNTGKYCASVSAFAFFDACGADGRREKAGFSSVDNGGTFNDLRMSVQYARYSADMYFSDGGGNLYGGVLSQVEHIRVDNRVLSGACGDVGSVFYVELTGGQRT